MPDLVVHEGGGDGSFQAEAFAEAAGGVVFAAAFPSRERAGGSNAALARIEAEHDLAERDLIEDGGFGGLDGEAHGGEMVGKLKMGSAA